MTGRRRNLAYITVWTSIFVALSVTEGVGDNHDGQRVPFWQAACMTNARGACDNLAIILDSYCERGSGWACNEVGALRASGRVRDAQRAGNNFARACEMGVPAACENIILAGQRVARQPPPTLKDYPIVLQSGKGPLKDQSPIGLLTQACSDAWMNGCESLAAMYLRGGDVPRDAVKAASYLERACTGGLPTACSNLGLMHHSGDGLPRDVEKGWAYLQRACDLGFSSACRWLKETRAPEGTR